MRTGIFFGLTVLFTLLAFIPPSGQGTVVQKAQAVKDLTLALNRDTANAVLGFHDQAVILSDSVANVGADIHIDLPEIDLPEKIDLSQFSLPKANLAAVDISKAELPNLELEQEVRQAAPSLLRKLLTAAADGVKNRTLPEPPVAESWRDAANAETNDTLRHHFLLVEWAREKHDVRACNELRPTVLEERTKDEKTYTTPSRGDWVAYCLARVTGNADRCMQIGLDILPPLKSLCDEELK